MAKQKTSVAEFQNSQDSSVNEDNGGIMNEAVNSVDGVQADGPNGDKRKEKKSATSYEVVDLPKNRDRLSPQLKALVEAVDENKEEIGGKQVVFRARLLAKWSEKIGSESGDKVFASYMHQL